MVEGSVLVDVQSSGKYSMSSGENRGSAYGGGASGDISHGVNSLGGEYLMCCRKNPINISATRHP